MNKWVVLFLMALAFLAGALSFRSGGIGGGPVATSTPSVPEPQRSAGPVEATSTPSTSITTQRTAREPHFGLPPGRRDKETAQKEATQPRRLAGASISALVFSTSVDGASRTRFPAESGPIFLTVTPFAVPDKVELMAAYRNSLKESEEFSAPVQSSGPPRKRSFRLSPPSGGWSSGPYQVVIKPAGSEQVLTLSRFEIDKKGAPEEPVYPTPEYIDLVSSPEDEDARSVFDQKDSQVGLLINTEGVPETVMVRTVWSAVEVEQLTPGEIVAVSEKAAPGPGKDAFFTFIPREGNFLPGSYRVDVYYDQQEMGSQAFFIQPAAKESASSSATP